MRTFVFILFIFIGFNAFAQKHGLLMDNATIDTTEVQLQRQMEYFRLINGQTNFIHQDLKLPDFKLNNSAPFNLFVKPTMNFTNISLLTNTSIPYYYDAKMLSSASYALGDKFTVGGFSYGANSVFSAPLPNQNSKSYFDTYGSTMFVQYKVSKNIKIEAGVSIQQGSGMP
jgi:hypothetical protein